MITVIGSVNLDLVARVERLPAAGETVPGDVFKTSPGGKGANQALAALRAGSQVRIVGAIGRDKFAEEAIACLVKDGVDTSGLREAAAATGIALIMVDGVGENVIAVIPGANATVLPGDMMAADIQRDEIVLLQLEIPLATVRAAIEATREAGGLSILNAAPFMAEAAELLTEADMVVFNETEFDLYADALAIAGRDRDSRLRAFAEHTGRTAVLTLGRDGVVAVSPEGRLVAQGLPVTPVDTVGAGDTFCGYLAAGLEQRQGFHDTLIAAAAAGSIACLKPGAQSAIPWRKQVERALARGLPQDDADR